MLTAAYKRAVTFVYILIVAVDYDGAVADVNFQLLYNMNVCKPQLRLPLRANLSFYL